MSQPSSVLYNVLDKTGALPTVMKVVNLPVWTKVNRLIGKSPAARKVADASVRLLVKTINNWRYSLVLLVVTVAWTAYSWNEQTHWWNYLFMATGPGLYLLYTVSSFRKERADIKANTPVLVNMWLTPPHWD